MDASDFDEQLRQQELEKEGKFEPQESSSAITYTDKDGTVYEWDFKQKVYVPKIDEDFIAQYQMNYGVADAANVTNNSTADIEYNQEPPKPVSYSDEQNKPSDTSAKYKPAQKSEDPGWFHVDDKHNLNVYVSGLPLDITDEEFLSIMKKCGLIMHDPMKRAAKIKLYKDDNGQPKGDGLCCYIKPESVSLALQILDGYDVRGKKIKVEMAKFEMKGKFDPSKKKRKLTNKEKKKFKEKQEKLFDWRPEPLRGMRFKREKTVILQNMFEPKEFEEDPSLLRELKDDVQSECSKFGEVRKIVIYDRNHKGVISVTFREPEEADECIVALNGRWFAQKKIVAETWDGKEKFDIAETEEERQDRLNKWQQFLQQGSTSKISNEAGGEHKTELASVSETPSAST
ncbi:HIV Tat-specific factor 1 homolog [Octopus bimaculoides]|uniref:17S U2 SnRNP complex component HTATSF1 n=1 Tax=Octopus bimaculoides TaxID=37653 RepID=A0A0L8FU55_OCTBM|nr:HIV Tat-specific factor 1 homolog [Octopus bimaculoides]XP_052826229.1 HIV Tat-specific factor 1 homolog [Octopus bimaculoides]|eukprot:XP_014787072.1 PREDICTED: HIV Tat-specific factor 1 homolog [Octopus bimaculoides]